MTADQSPPVMRCLCVGGTHDGEYVEATPMGTRGQMRMHRKDRPAIRMQDGPSAIAATTTVSEVFDYYRIEQIHFPEGLFSLWVEESIAPFQMMEKLIRRYANAAVSSLEAAGVQS